MPSAKRLDDLEMQVGSPGLGQALQSAAPIPKHAAVKKVDVSWRRHLARPSWRLSVTTTGITLRIEQPSKVKGRQPKLSDERQR
jgi:hypothetical protein